MPVKITVYGHEYEMPEHFTYGELFDIEQKIGANAGPIAQMYGQVWVAVRRKIPDFKFEDLRDQQLDVDEILKAQEADASPPAGGQFADGGDASSASARDESGHRVFSGSPS